MHYAYYAQHYCLDVYLSSYIDEILYYYNVNNNEKLYVVIKIIIVWKFFNLT